MPLILEVKADHRLEVEAVAFRVVEFRIKDLWTPMKLASFDCDVKWCGRCSKMSIAGSRELTDADSSMWELILIAVLVNARVV